MESIAKVSLILFVASVLIAAASAGPHKKQIKVPANHTCSCDGYVAQAKLCSWTPLTCDETSQPFKNYQYWCGQMNGYRHRRRNGLTANNYNRSLTCKSNLSRKEREAIDCSLKTPATPKSLTVWTNYNPRIPFNAAVPTATVDWTSKMTPIKNQGQCGSCWAFAVVGYFEYWYKKKNAVTQTFAEQRLVSCETDASGCNGGFQGTALDYLMNTGTVLTSTHPYTSGTTKVSGTCPANKATIYKAPQSYYEWYTTGGSVNPANSIQSGNCTRMKQLLAQGPVVASIYAMTGFMQYKTGIYNGETGCPNTGAVNHGIIVTGFIKNYLKSGTDVFVIRNSWGTGWGTNGYGYINANGNICSICSRFFYY